MKKKVIIILLAIVSMAMLTSCTTNNQVDSTEQSANTIDLGVLIYRFDDAFISTVRDEMAIYCDDIGDGDGLVINPIFMDANNQQEVQFEQLQELINLEVDVLCINIVNRETASDMIDMAREAEIPIVFFNREPVAIDIMRWDRVYYVGCDAGESGRLQGEMVLDYWLNNQYIDTNQDGVMQCVYLKGEPNHQDTQLRTDNNIEVFEKNQLPIEILAEYTANWQREEAKNQITTCLDAFGYNVEVIISNNDEMALGAISALKAYSDNMIPVFGIDATSYAIESLKANELTGTVLNDGVSQARGVIDIALELVQDEETGKISKLEKGRYYWVPYKKIVKEDIA